MSQGECALSQTNPSSVLIEMVELQGDSNCHEKIQQSESANGLSSSKHGSPVSSLSASDENPSTIFRLYQVGRSF